MEVSSISYIVLLVLALYCLYTYYQSVGTDFLHFAYPTFIVVAANAAVGVYWECKYLHSLNSLVKLVGIISV